LFTILVYVAPRQNGAQGAIHMNNQTSDLGTAASPDAAVVRFIAHVRDAVSCTAAAEEGEDAQARAVRQEGARVMFTALRPRDPMEAALAARAVAAHHAAMDMYARAARPGTPDDKAMRLRNSAIAASRSYDVALRELGKRQGKPTAAPKDAALPAAAGHEPTHQPVPTAPSLPVARTAQPPPIPVAVQRRETQGGHDIAALVAEAVCAEAATRPGQPAAGAMVAGRVGDAMQQARGQDPASRSG
jgi:hypothetical protein